MGADISNLVIFEGDDEEQIRRLKQVVQWVADTPEGFAKLKEAKELHKMPLRIISVSSNPLPGYYPHNGIVPTNSIKLNTHLVEAMKYVDEQGELRPYSLERFIAHELLHATQANLAEDGEDYHAKFTEIALEARRNFVPMDDYRNQLIAARYNDDKLKIILGEIFDKYVSPNTPQIRKATLDAAVKDPEITEFWEKYETPAINFENLLMAKYKHEPCRSTDYSLGDPSLTMDYAIASRDDFIEDSIGTMHAVNEYESSMQAEAANVGSGKKPRYSSQSRGSRPKIKL